MIAVVGAGLLFGIKVALHHKEKKDADKGQQRQSDAHGGAAERRASQWLSSQAYSARDSLATSIDHPTSQHALLDEGYLVCFTNSKNEVLCVTNLGSRHEIGWHKQSAPEGRNTATRCPGVGCLLATSCASR
jgi:hypothetical protein